MRTAYDLIQSGECTGNCLTGAEETIATCTCRCGGAYHGTLAFAEVEPNPDTLPWWWDYWPSAPNSIAINRVQSMATQVGAYQRRGNDRTEHWVERDSNPESYSAHSQPRHAHPESDNMKNVRKVASAAGARFKGTVAGGHKGASVYGIPTEREAQIVTAMMWLASTGRPIERHVAALTRPDTPAMMDA